MSDEILKLVLDTLPVRVFWKDKSSTFLGGNSKFIEDMQAGSLEELVGKSDADFCDTKEELESFFSDDQEVIRSGVSKLGIEESQTIGENTKWLRTNKVPLIDSTGELIGLLGTYDDITEQITYREKIEDQALIDSLTGLANRRKLQKTVASFEGDFAGLLFIDLDYFKIVNDSLGHSMGDSLLRLVAIRLDEVVSSKGGLVARLGGDEFSVFVPLRDTASAQDTLKDMASSILDSFNESFFLEHHVLKLAASIGITIMSSADLDYSQAFREADIAMYRAKEEGRGGFQFYNDEMKQKAKRKHLLNLHLRQAIENNELSLVYQPQFDHKQVLIGVEALLRWNSQELGFVPPDEFISVTEETGLIHTIGTWVYETALNDLVIWQAHLPNKDNFKLAINFSSRQFQNSNLSKEVVQAISERGLNPINIQVEITESMLMDQKSQAIQTMLRFQKTGISIAIDDFGTGYSSLSYLANLPIDKLKIDRSFVQDLHKRSTNNKLVGTLINMAKNLHMEVIAEGVELQEEQAALINLGCFQFQGYLYSKPISSIDLLEKYIKR